VKNYYEVLGIDLDASLGQIKDAFRRAAMRWHPDRNQDAPEESGHRFKEASEAYAVLSDPAQRQAHDEALRRGGPHPDDVNLAHLFGQDPIDLGPLDEDFHQAMMQMARAMAADGHGRDTLVAALTARGCTDREAHAIASDALGGHARARKGVSASRDRGTQRLLLLLAGVVGAVLLGAYFFARLHVPSSAENASSATAVGAAGPDARTARDVTAVVDKPRRPALAVAGPQTRLRSGAGPHFPVVAVAGRGDVVEVVEPGQGFQRVRQRNGALGWIADDALVDVPSAQRLAGLTARQYATTPPRSRSLEHFAIAMERQDPGRVHTALASAGDARAPQAALRAGPAAGWPEATDRDPQAARWWLLEARWLAANRAAPAQQLDAATAAVQADPSDVDALAALGIASIEAGRHGRAFDRVAYLLARLAPGAPATRLVLAEWADHNDGHAQRATAARAAAGGRNAPSAAPPMQPAVRADAPPPVDVARPKQQQATRPRMGTASSSDAATPAVAQPLMPLAEVTLSRRRDAALAREPMFEPRPATAQRAAVQTSFDPPAAARCGVTGSSSTSSQRPIGERIALPLPTDGRPHGACPPGTATIDAR